VPGAPECSGLALLVPLPLDAECPGEGLEVRELEGAELGAAETGDAEHAAGAAIPDEDPSSRQETRPGFPRPSPSRLPRATLLDPDKIPARPHGFIATDPKVRARRLRRLADDHRADGHDALLEASKLDLGLILGKRAPEPRRTAVLAERVTRSATLIARAERLLQYAKELDEISLSDALLLLEAMKREVDHETTVQ